MGNRNDAEVEVRVGDSFRLANLIAIREQLFAAKTDRAGRGGGSRRQFEKRWRFTFEIWRIIIGRTNGFPRFDNPARATDFKGGVALLIADRLFKR